MGTLTDYANNAGLSPEACLGRIVFVTVNDTSVAHSTLAAELAAANLDRYLPRPPADADVFRRAFQNGQRRTHSTADPEVSINLLVRQLDAKDGKITKRIVVEQVDAGGRRLDYTEAVEVTFDGDNPSKLAVSVLGEVNTRALSLAGELTGEYTSHRGCVNAQAVREVVRRVLDDALATNIKGGVHFVMQDHADVVDRVEVLGGRLPGCDIHSLPLVDTDKQRDMVKRAYEEETVGELGRLEHDLAELLGKSEPPSARALAALVARRARLTDRLKGYSDLLETNLSNTAFKMRVVERQIERLSSKAFASFGTPAGRVA